MSLSRLVEMQKQAKLAKESETSSGAQPASQSAVGPESGDQGPPPVEQLPAPAPKRLPFGNMGNKPKPAPAPTPAPTEKPKEVLSLDNLGSFDLALIEDAGDDEVPEFAGFHDEIEATAPDRELPEEMTEGMKMFVESLDSIYTILNDSQMFGQQIRQIMMELQENPEYEKLISDTDVHVMIRAMRNTMGLARVRKQAKSRKSGTTAKSRTPSRKQALMDKALSLSIGIPGLGDDVE